METEQESLGKIKATEIRSMMRRLSKTIKQIYGDDRKIEKRKTRITRTNRALPKVVFFRHHEVLSVSIT